MQCEELPLVSCTGSEGSVRINSWCQWSEVLYLADMSCSLSMYCVLNAGYIRPHRDPGALHVQVDTKWGYGRGGSKPSGAYVYTCHVGLRGFYSPV